MPYCFGGSSIKFQGHTGWKIEDLNPVWVRILGRSQLSNPSDLPCCNFGTILTQCNRSNLGFPGISWRTHGGNGLKYGMLLYPDHLQNWLDYGYSLVIFSCDQAALQMVFSVCLSVRPSVHPSHLYHHVPIIVSSWNFLELLPMTKVTSMQKVKARGQRWKSQRSTPNLTVSGL